VETAQTAPASFREKAGTSLDPHCDHVGGKQGGAHPRGKMLEKSASLTVIREKLGKMCSCVTVCNVVYNTCSEVDKREVKCQESREELLLHLVAGHLTVTSVLVFIIFVTLWGP